AAFELAGRKRLRAFQGQGDWVRSQSPLMLRWKWSVLPLLGRLWGRLRLLVVYPHSSRYPDRDCSGGIGEGFTCWGHSSVALSPATKKAAVVEHPGGIRPHRLTRQLAPRAALPFTKGFD